MQKRIALFGGTFDPPHLAHRKLLDEIQEQYSFDKILVIPSKFPPGKTASAPFEKRLSWSKEIFEGGVYEVSDLENRSSQTVFAREIFYELRLQSPEAEYYWILGEDQWQQLNFWKNIDDYAADLFWLMLPREEHAAQEFQGLMSRRLHKTTCKYLIAKINRQPEVSSTEIRKAIMKEPGFSKTALTWIPDGIREEVMETYNQAEKGA